MDRMCLNATSICDGTHDCQIQTDILNLTFFSFLPLPHSDEYPSFCENFNCPKGSTKCANGCQCLPDEQWHDGVIDCKDSEDDETVTCGVGYFKCSDNKCMPENWLCDGDNDCEDGADEIGCTSCNGTAFYCGDGMNKCLPRRDVCDGYKDCPNGSDEHEDCGADYNEHHGRFPNHRHTTVNITRDMEYHSRGASMFCDNSKEMHCRNAWRDFGDGVKCLPYSQVCDSTINCPFSDDELSYPKALEEDHLAVQHIDDSCTDSCTNVDEMRRSGQWNCDGACVPTPGGPMCTCATGLYWDNAAFTCHDVDECELHDRCQQQCNNFIGGFECKCIDGYIKEGTGSCRAKTESTIIMLFDDHLEWSKLNTSDITMSTTDTSGIHRLDMDVVNTVISITSDPARNDIFILDLDGLISRCPMSFPADGLEKYNQYLALNAKKIEYDLTGDLLYAHNGKSIFAIARGGAYVTHVGHFTLNDFTLVPQMGVIIYATDSAIKLVNMDGTNDMMLFNATRVRFTSVKVDYPSQRIFYTAEGMPAGTSRVMSSKFDGSDKFRHYTISNSSMERPVIQLFENKLFVTDGARQSLIYHGDKFTTRDSIYDKMIIMKLAIDIAISNVVLTASPLSAQITKSPGPGVFRFARNKALSPSEIINDVKSGNVRVELVYRCGNASPQTYKSEPDCSNTDCPMPVITADNVAVASLNRSGKTLTVKCNDGYQIGDVKSAATSLTCTNGAWSGSFQCVPIQCPQLPKFEYQDGNNIIDYSNIMVPVPGDTAFIQCYPETFYSGMSNVTM